uniref:Uncharacterized protein n=1 Tax=Arundo donax TaxID=35708 RepID=A0A0A9CN19_ARUDO
MQYAGLDKEECGLGNEKKIYMLQHKNYNHIFLEHSKTVEKNLCHDPVIHASMQH